MSRKGSSCNRKSFSEFNRQSWNFQHSCFLICSLGMALNVDLYKLQETNKRPVERLTFPFPFVHHQFIPQQRPPGDYYGFLKLSNKWEQKSDSYKPVSSISGLETAYCLFVFTFLGQVYRISQQTGGLPNYETINRRNKN